MLRFDVLFLLGFILCEGKVSSLNGTKVTVTPGSTGRIVWSFDDKIQSFTSRLWTMVSNDGQRAVGLAKISSDGDVQILTSLYDVTVEKPGTLVLKNVNLTYNGTYQFSLAPGGHSAVLVYIAVKPKATACFSNIIVNEGDDVSYACQGQGGNPPADVTWYKDGNKIGETGKEEKTLTLTSVTNENAHGRYKCVAESYPSEMFRDEVIVEVIVNYKPTQPVITLPEKNLAFVGKNFTITCFANGLPEPSYAITHNGTLISSNEATYSNFAKWDDAGIYTCNATNKLSTNSSCATLIVQERAPPGDEGSSVGLGPGTIVAICLGVLLLSVIVVIVVYFCNKSKEKYGSNRGNIDPVTGNHYDLDEEPGPAENAYDTVGPVGESGSKKKAPEKGTPPPVYATVDKNNRDGYPLDASLDTDAMKPKTESKKEPEQTPPTEYATIDFAKSTKVPKAHLV